jgi:hypothetical protein
MIRIKKRENLLNANSKEEKKDLKWDQGEVWMGEGFYSWGRGVSSLLGSEVCSVCIGDSQMTQGAHGSEVTCCRSTPACH